MKAKFTFFLNNIITEEFLSNKNLVLTCDVTYCLLLFVCIILSSVLYLLLNSSPYLFKPFLLVKLLEFLSVTLKLMVNLCGLN